MTPVDVEAIRSRPREQFEGRGMDAKELAGLTGHNVRTVRGYVSGEGRSTPADFIGDCERVGFASARWLLLGVGPRIPVDASESEQALEEIAEIAEIAEIVRRVTGDVK